MTLVTLAQALLAAAGVVLVVRMVKGPTVADRVVTVDGFLIVVIGFLAANAASTGSSLFVDVALVIGLLAFVGTCIAARFIERRGT